MTQSNGKPPGGKPPLRLVGRTTDTTPSSCNGPAQDAPSFLRNVDMMIASPDGKNWKLSVCAGGKNFYFSIRESALHRFMAELHASMARRTETPTNL